MELFSKFKRDYVNYLISIIIPAFVSGISIPLFKYLLGADDYGKFALWFNGILIATAILSGWIGPSILRLYPKHPQHKQFSDYSLKLSLTTQLLFVAPVFVLAFLISNDFILSILCCLALVASTLEFTIYPIIQSALLSRKIIYSEFVRVMIYVGGSVMLLVFTKVYFLYSLFSAIIISYLIPFFYLLHQKNKFISDETHEFFDKKSQLKKFISYGVPLSFWFVFTYLLTYIDKLFTLKFFGGVVQGNYQALFDLISKSIILIISPAMASLIPLLTSAYERKELSSARQLVLRILVIELAGFFLVVLGYWVIGAQILFYILKVPDSSVFRWAGFIIICATFIWQFAILMQKRLELHMKTRLLLMLAGFALLLQVIFYFLFRNSGYLLVAPVGYLLASLFYLAAMVIPVSRDIVLKRQQFFKKMTL